MARVIVLDDIAPEGMELLEQAPGIEFDVKTGLKGDDLKKELAEYDGAVCRSGVKITAESLEGNKRLKAIVRAGVGTDNIDKEASTRAGIVVMNTPTGNTVSTAEHAMALMMGLARNIAAANQSLVEGRWDRKLYMGSQLAGKTLGIVGLGRIGQEVAKRAKAFEMNVIGFDPFLPDEQARKLGIEKVALVEDLLPQVDFLTVHTPLTPETKGLINSESLKKIKKGARLINCARGGIYDEAAMLEGLEAGQIAGVALDVYPEEPCTDSPLFGRSGVLCTPHLGASTEEAQTQVAVEAVHLLVNYLTNGEIRHAVNTAALDPKTLARMKGHIDVAVRLGQLLGQWHGGAISQAKLEYRGELIDLDTKLLTSAFCAGLLAGNVDGDANIVNARVFCEERGVSITEQASRDGGAFRAAMVASVEGEGISHTAGGTLFGESMPRLFRMGDFQLEAYLDGTMIVFAHRDVPGIIGRVGTKLAEVDVNIAQMSVGRSGNEPGGTALGVLNVDHVVSDDVLESVAKIDNIEDVKQIVLPNRGVLPSWL